MAAPAVFAAQGARKRLAGEPPQTFVGTTRLRVLHKRLKLLSRSLCCVSSPHKALWRWAASGSDGIACSPRALTLGQIGPKRNSGEWGLTVPGSSDVKSVSSKTSLSTAIFISDRELIFQNTFMILRVFISALPSRCRAGQGMARGSAGSSWRKRLRQNEACKTPEAASKKPAFSLDKPPEKILFFVVTSRGNFLDSYRQVRYNNL